jgi:hypothetical protein
MSDLSTIVALGLCALVAGAALFCLKLVLSKRQRRCYRSSAVDDRGEVGIAGRPRQAKPFQFGTV